MFEILAALAFLTFAGTKQKFEQAHANGLDYGNFVWSPVTRASWDTTTRNIILAELDQPEIRSAILNAGFCNKDEESLNLAIESIQRLAIRLSWQ
jgi:hypothetical protein